MARSPSIRKDRGHAVPLEPRGVLDLGELSILAARPVPDPISTRVSRSGEADLLVEPACSVGIPWRPERNLLDTAVAECAKKVLHESRRYTTAPHIRMSEEGHDLGTVRFLGSGYCMGERADLAIDLSDEQHIRRSPNSGGRVPPTDAPTLRRRSEK